MSTSSDPTATQPALLGRYGDPACDYRSDPRSDPRMVEALAAFGLAMRGDDPPVTASDPLDARLEFMNAAEAGFEALFGALAADLPPFTGVTRSVESVTGVDGNDIALFIHRPAEADSPLPGILFLHSGGMALLGADEPMFLRWYDELAATGLVVIGVDFRNAAGKRGAHPFPAGLNDCVSALEWAHANRSALGIDKLVVAGDSGGGNLALATALKAKREGKTHLIDGVYAIAPHISGAFDWPAEKMARELPSLIENDGYFTSLAMSRVLASVYDPDGAHRDDPLAWPYRATEDDLAGLPPHTISTSELDSVRDEGLAYARNLTRAGVSVVSRTVAGIVHDGDVIFETAVPDLHTAVVRDIHGFATAR
jgi:acetyl esterase/lipase